MGETHDAHPATGQHVSDDGDPDSPARSTFFSRLFRREPPETEDRADEGESEDADSSGEMLLNLRNLASMRVDDVSVPRAEIVAVADDCSLEDLVETFRESTLSRLPVYTESLDQPRGMVHLKDFALTYGFGAPADGFALEPMIRPLLYVPPSMPIGALLHKMRAAHIHMALVIDEYGGVDGLVTIEDLVEQIVGDIADEHDEAESQLWAREPDGAIVAQARVELDDFEDETGIELLPPDRADEVDTLGGLVVLLAGRVPAVGELVEHPAGHEFEVLDGDVRRITRLRLRPGGDVRAAAE
ncbi:hemolysin family protein [Amaricoccus solimangrovi]|uniref:HlyC/CorC family transporter n=1 Tax=Amaricoccus solimangrovi TaxID=2589815 RepID=A0A501WPE2_9RHOB|nr:hemolysin family protein [Amaricoccus solimangrovi]TPE50210.1 HlyC/CorC family transporter [Amaricoccus solimangrovi]